MSRQLTPKAQVTREKILRAANDLFYLHGYNATGVDRICEVAEVHKGSFYHHFASKEELAIAAIDDQWQRMKPRIDAIFSPATPPLQRLANYIRHSVQMQREKQQQTGCVCGCPLYALGSEMGTLAPALQEKIQELVGIKLCYLVSAVSEAHTSGEIVAPDPRRTAQTLIDLTEGVLMRARIMNDLAPLADLEDSLFGILGCQPVAR